MKEIEEEEAALAEMTKLIGAIIPRRRLTFRRERGSRRSRNTRQEEENAVFAFFNDDTPAQVGEVRYYQEEYEEKKDISELQELNLSKLQESQPKQPEETSSAATSHLQDEPSAVNYKIENETSTKEEAKAQTKASNEVDVTFEVLEHAVPRGGAKFRGNREAPMNIRFGPL
ncbi:hypothetical protein QR685DRAFT_235844 [Neurospora intermedia]|uniref:Uncharacterized protein n=1 Tax=Neurospora intermedia TaxID=5142 RepID=A0ABR3DKK5_NEUIN